jgi:hypothetical protein
MRSNLSRNTSESQVFRELFCGGCTTVAQGVVKGSTKPAEGPPNAVVAAAVGCIANGAVPAEGAREPEFANSPLCTAEEYPLVLWMLKL